MKKLKKKIAKKIIVSLLSSNAGLVVVGIIVLISVLLIMDFFGVNKTDGYVENNSEYAEEYKMVLNKYVPTNKGYVSLERILYFYLADDSFTFDEIYQDNLDEETKRQLPISEVCKLEKYNVLEVCDEDNLEESNQIDEVVSKPFSPPVDFSSSMVTSFFMEERIVYGKANIHSAWDLSNKAEANVYAVCDGTVKSVSFPYATNSINISDTQGGNTITLTCDVNEIEYKVFYGHLYPNSAKVNVGDQVSKGQVIAGVGTTGYSTGNHLHYQISNSEGKVDGMSLIDFTFNDDSQ